MNKISILKRIPRTVSMLAGIEWGQLCSRGIKQYTQFRYKSLRSQFDRSYPNALQIEPFGGCNIRCSMCFQGRIDLPADKIYLDMNLYKRVIDQASNLTSRLYLYWRGEPTMHPQLPEMISYAHQHNLYVFISTNGVLIKEQLARELVDANLDFLLVGFDGATKESYEKMRRGSKFENIIASIKYISEYKKMSKKHLPHICLQLIVSSVNQNELVEFRKLSSNIGADSYIEKILDVYSNFENSKIDNSLRPLFVGGDWSKYSESNDNLEITRNITECEQAKRLVVRADGEINLCCYDMQGKYKIGSITNEKELDIKFLWGKPDYRRLRQQGQYRKLALCKNCGAGIQR